VYYKQQQLLQAAVRRFLTAELQDVLGLAAHDKGTIWHDQVLVSIALSNGQYLSYPVQLYSCGLQG